ncbi:MAG: hypothetical protein HZRFUVUK_001972, partial [Candidatus Fervidibacterota bacterium]
MGWAMALATLLIGFVMEQCLMNAKDAPSSDEVEWKMVGPGGGGWIQSVAFDPKDPDTIYVGCDVGG